LSNKKIVYPGVPGSYTEEAALKYFGVDNDFTGKPGFEEVTDTLLKSKADYAVLPIENSSTGSINQVVDLIREKDLYITGEIVKRIEHYLLGVQGAELNTVKKVKSHPQGLEQCGRYLKAKAWELETSSNTAIAAKDVSQKGDKALAAIASKRAALIYGLTILDSNIHDNSNNFTRFAVLSLSHQKIPYADKISLVFIVKNIPGSLYSAIQGFADNNVNLIKLESRPIWTEPWHYFFHMDLEGNPDDSNVKKALCHLEIYCKSYRILGNYRKYTEIY